mmetsp:Transcript_22712/g.53796  ORF Transcript_22712/g.53796 Transcript_22712/m.53796 type:complete len:789 (+) Transcript_22712:217-2583(+)
MNTIPETETETDTATEAERPKQPFSSSNVIKYTPTHRLIRFKWWVVMILCSIIFSSSLVEAYRRLYGGVIDGNLTDGQQRTFKFAFASTGLGVVGLVVSILPYKWCTRVESILIIAIVSTYAVGSVFATTNPEPPAVDEGFVVATPNMYFFGWGCVYTSIILFASWVEHNIQNDEGICSMQWILLGSTSVVTLLSALSFREYSAENIIVFAGNGTLKLNGTADMDELRNSSSTAGDSVCQVFDQVDCGRVDLAICFGAISSAASLVIAPWRNAPVVCQAEAAVLLLTMWIVGVVLLTFETGPGKIMNTIYFSTWINFFLSLNIATKTLGMYIDLPKQDSDEPDRDTNVEEDNDNIECDEQTKADMNANDINTDCDEQSAQAPDKQTKDGSNQFMRKRPTTMERGEIFQTAFSKLTYRRNPSASTIRRQYTGGSLFESVNEDFAVITDPLSTEETSESPDSKIARERMRQLQHWAALLISSIVCLCSLYPSLPPKSSRTTDDKVSIAVPSASIGLSCLGYLSCIRTTKCARCSELLFIGSCGVAWAFGMRFIFRTEYLTHNSYDIEISTIEKLDPNVFFSTWAGLLISILLLTRWLKLSLESTDWFLLSFFSFALMGTSLVSYNDTIRIVSDDGTEVEFRTCEREEATDCDRMRASAWLGIVSGAVAMIICPMSIFVIPGLDAFISMTIHVVIGILFLLAWMIGVGIIAYGTGHGAQTGSAYIEVWACVFLALDIATTNIVLLIKERKRRRQNIEHHDDVASNDDDDDGEAKESEEEANATPESADVAT